MGAFTNTFGKVIQGSGLDQNITDAMMEEGSEFYMVEEDNSENYLQLVELT
jgi:hypothetical protein